MSDDPYSPIAQAIHSITTTLLDTTNRPLNDDQRLFIETIHKQAERFCEMVEACHPQLEQMRAGEAYHPVGHDLLTPLVSVIGYAEIMKIGVGGMLGDDDQEHILEILEKGYHLRDLIDDLMISAKIKTGLMKDSDLSERHIP